MEDLIAAIAKELIENSDPQYRITAQRFYKNGISCVGVRTPVVRKISSKYFKKVKALPKEEIFDFCRKLLERNASEFSIIAFDWASKLKKKFEVSDIYYFESWVDKFVDNWSKNDDLCARVLGPYFFKFDDQIPRLPIWAKEKNKWFRRAAAVSLIYSVKREKNIEEGFKIAEILLKDKDDMVRKGYGWLLKEISNKSLEKVYDFVKKHETEMPRISLRYAIEKFPENIRKEFIKKNS